MKIRGIEYYTEIHSDGQPLILLHGFTGSSAGWINILGYLPTFKCITIDIIGHGKTEAPELSSRYSMEEAVEDLAAILDELNISKANILGYSMGGRLALSFAATYPERVHKLILESSSPGLDSDKERRIRRQADGQLAEEILDKGIEKFIDKWESIPLFSSQLSLPKSKRSNIRKQRLSNNPQGLANSLIGMGTGSQKSLWNKLPYLNMPVLLICGELDKKFCLIAEKMKFQLPNATIRQINGVGHAIHVEQPQIFGNIVNEFLIK